MFNSMERFNKKGKVYSFGRVSKINDKEYVVEYKNSNFVIKTQEKYKIGDWVVFYGVFNNGVVQAEYVENISGVDVNILERFVNFLEDNA
jgi:hypothetical protein